MHHTNQKHLSAANSNGKVFAQTTKKVKDELEYATNWQRAFLNLFTRLKWLNAFAQINYIALQKSLKKFMKAYFVLEDNVIDKQIQKYINDQTFTSKKNVKNVIEQIIECYAENFT